LPPENRFPLNIPSQRTVQSTVIPDLLNSDNPLLVTGYASLDHIIALISQLPANATQVRLLFGSEPFPSRKEVFPMSQHSFPAEVEHYWLSRGVSLLLSERIVFARELLASGRIAARHLGTNHNRLHAKIYCGDEAVTLGSSNFTAPGMQRQIEANVRFLVRAKSAGSRKQRE
jgi:phosphatidylserine/phosphatidylglycerophosphate/cardiolipin synthase-like enzyme